MFTILSRATFVAVLTSSLILSTAYSEEKSFPKGEQTYKDICGRCHEAGIGPDFKVENYLQHSSSLWREVVFKQCLHFQCRT